MKPVVKIKFSNGAGNNIFQYIYARLLAEAIDGELCHPALPVLGIKTNQIPFNPELKTVGIIGNSNNPVNYHKLLHDKMRVNYDLQIYPEDFALYTSVIEKIKSWFLVVEKTNNDDLVFHLRLGDRLVMLSTYKEENYVTADEFKKAIDSFDFKKLHIVTDMPIWREITVDDVKGFKFHRDVKSIDRCFPQTSVDYFNKIYKMLQEYDPIVKVGNSVQSDFDYMRGFDKILFQHGTLSWWAAALSKATDVALYGRWRGGKNINLGWTDFPGWRQWGRKTAPHHDIKDMHLKDLALKNNLRVFVETGTRGGTALQALHPYFDKMHSVEIIEAAYKKVVSKMNKYKHIKLYLGDSAKVIPEILKQIKEPTLFWLDAHDGRNSTPILTELKYILPSKLKHVIVIDDLRYFGTESAYPTVDEVISVVRELSPSAEINFKFDSIRIFK